MGITGRGLRMVVIDPNTVRFSDMPSPQERVRVVRGYIQQAMNLAHKRGTTIVAASGYEIDPLQKTFAVYPEEKKIVS